MKKGIVLLLSFMSYGYIIGQYNYGLDVCDQDAKIEGKLNLNNGQDDVIIGTDAGINLDNSGGGLNALWNVFIGHRAGVNTTTGHSNVFIGMRAGDANTSGRQNTYVGATCGPNE